MGRERGFKCVVAPRGDKGLNLARELRPAAITLDIRLPDMAGWLVLSRLKYDPATRHIPVHVISVDEDYRRGLALGAESYLEKTENADALRETFDKIQKLRPRSGPFASAGRRRRSAPQIDHGTDRR